jgi:hypothetical protein
MTTSTNDTFTSAYRAILTAVFVGIADALISLIYNIVYRSIRPDFSQDLLNVAYLIFGTVFLFFVIGIIFMGLRLLNKKGSLIFIVLFAALTLLAFIAVGTAHLTSSETENCSYRGILRGLILLDGITATFLVPYFYSNPAFEAYVV